MHIAKARWFFTAVLFLLAYKPSIAQDPIPLVLKGKFDVVKVTHYVPVVNERQAAKEFPFTVECPPKAFRPTFTTSAGVLATQKGGVLTVTLAPKGECRISATWGVIDFAKGESREEYGEAVFFIGDVIPPKPPEPPAPPTPDTALYKALKAAYDTELDTDKAAKVLMFAALLDGAVPAAIAANNKAIADKVPLKVKTAGDFVGLMHQATDLAIGAKGIPAVRSAVGAYLQTALPRAPATPADEAYFTKVSSEHGFVALTLRTIK